MCSVLLRENLCWNWDMWWSPYHARISYIATNASRKSEKKSGQAINSQPQNRTIPRDPPPRSEQNTQFHPDLTFVDNSNSYKRCDSGHRDSWSPPALDTGCTTRCPTSIYAPPPPPWPPSPTNNRFPHRRSTVDTTWCKPNPVRTPSNTSGWQNRFPRAAPQRRTPDLRREGRRGAGRWVRGCREVQGRWGTCTDKEYRAATSLSLMMAVHHDSIFVSPFGSAGRSAVAASSASWSRRGARESDFRTLVRQTMRRRCAWGRGRGGDRRGLGRGGGEGGGLIV